MKDLWVELKRLSIETDLVNFVMLPVITIRVIVRHSANHHDKAIANSTPRTGARRFPSVSNSATVSRDAYSQFLLR